MEFRAEGGAEDDGVISPDHPLRSDALAQRLECLQGRRQGKSARLKFRGIVKERVLKVVPVSPIVQLLKIREEGPRVPGPEDDAVNVPRQERNPEDLFPIERVGDLAPSFPNSVDKPRSIKSGDVGSPAG